MVRHFWFPRANFLIPRENVLPRFARKNNFLPRNQKVCPRESKVCLTIFLPLASIFPCDRNNYSFMLTPFPCVSSPGIFVPRKSKLVPRCTIFWRPSPAQGRNHFSVPGVESLFRPWDGITFPSLGWKQYQSDSFPGVEKLFLFWILSPQISILPWLGLHKAWNLQMNLGVTLKNRGPSVSQSAP